MAEIVHLPLDGQGAAELLMSLPLATIVAAATAGSAEQLGRYAMACRIAAGNLERCGPPVGNSHLYVTAKALRECAAVAHVTIRGIERAGRGALAEAPA